MQTREQELAELKTVYIESSREDRPLLADGLIQEISYSANCSKSTAFMAFIASLPGLVELPPTLIAIIDSYHTQYYFCCHDLIKSSAYSGLPRSLTAIEKSFYITEIERLRNDIESLFLTRVKSACDRFKKEHSPNLKAVECLFTKNTTSDTSYQRVFAQYSMFKHNQNLFISVCAYHISDFTIVLSEPINLVYNLEDKKLKSSGTNHTLANAVCIKNEIRGYNAQLLNMVVYGEPYRYVMRDKEQKLDDVTEQLQNCHRLFSHKTTVKPPHKPHPELPPLPEFFRTYVKKKVKEKVITETKSCAQEKKA